MPTKEPAEDDPLLADAEAGKGCEFVAPVGPFECHTPHVHSRSRVDDGKDENVGRASMGDFQNLVTRLAILYRMPVASLLAIPHVTLLSPRGQ